MACTLEALTLAPYAYWDGFFRLWTTERLLSWHDDVISAWHDFIGGMK